MNLQQSERILNLKFNVSSEANDMKQLLKKKYNEAALIYHPDKKGGSVEKFNELNEAYKVFFREIRKLKQNDSSIKKKEDILKDFDKYKIKSAYELPVDSYFEPINIPNNITEKNFNESFNTVSKELSGKLQIVKTNEVCTYDKMYETTLYELGKTKVNDFSTPKVTDFSKAYTYYNTLTPHHINKPIVKKEKLSSLDFKKYQEERNNLSIHFLEQKPNVLNNEEQDRLDNLLKQDLEIAEQYKRLFR